jgi:hypothetical protein
MNKKLNYGKEDVLTDSDLDIRQAKIRITTMIDFDVYELLKDRAKLHGIGYQTLINKILGAYIAGENKLFPENPAQDALAAFMKEMQSIRKEVKDIKKEVYKKKMA